MAGEKFFPDGIPPEIQPFWDSDEFNFKIERASIQKGRTISHEAVMAAMEHIHDFVQVQIMKAWDQRGEPPTVVEVTVKVTSG